MGRSTKAVSLMPFKMYDVFVLGIERSSVMMWGEMGRMKLREEKRRASGRPRAASQVLGRAGLGCPHLQDVCGGTGI
jgi:hypothetical protein